MHGLKSIYIDDAVQNLLSLCDTCGFNYKFLVIADTNQVVTRGQTAQ